VKTSTECRRCVKKWHKHGGDEQPSFLKSLRTTYSSSIIGKMSGENVPVLTFVGGTFQVEFYKNSDSRWAVLRQLLFGAYVGDAIHISGATWTAIMDIIPLLQGINQEYNKMIIRGTLDDEDV
jgi:hypothetical protein